MEKYVFGAKNTFFKWFAPKTWFLVKKLDFLRRLRPFLAPGPISSQKMGFSSACVHAVKSKGKIPPNFVAFSEYMNFTIGFLHCCLAGWKIGWKRGQHWLAMWLRWRSRKHFRFPFPPPQHRRPNFCTIFRGLFPALLVSIHAVQFHVLKKMLIINC